ncbi:MAG: DNA mismatch repair endonuclease MutL [Raineya sp.]|nr:DNA mismatch repair endonuclease MutL [Raineya sp.]
MQDVIRLLPDSLANQIAAGEVVQRPASVVKELLENSIDAGASQIQLIIKDAGKTLIQVIDDGIGMSETDARMSFERHATSKIRTQEDLFRIMTMGFRGEALASIAAVAQVEMRTRREIDDIGTQIIIEGSELKSQNKINCPKGTSIAVKNLFFNVPARRNFLKSNPIETKHIIEEFQRVALAFPEISFKMYHNEEEIYNLPKGKLAQRIVGIFGKNYREGLIPCQEDTPLLKIKGYIGKPELAKKTRGEQFFFVNNRFIKHAYLHHAVMTCYQDLLPKEHTPFYALFLEIEPQHIDINVHPTKTEIKFDDEKTIYAILQATVRKALASVQNNLDFEEKSFDLADAYTPTSKTSQDFSYKPQNLSNQNFSSFWKTNYREKSNLRNWESIFAGLKSQAIQVFEQEKSDLFPQETSTESTNTLPKEYENPETKTFQLHQRYIVTQIKAGLLIIDQHLAHQRILYDRFLQLLQNQGLGRVSQQLLFPIQIPLNPADLALLQDITQEITHLGFNFELTPEGMILYGTPPQLPHEQEKEIVESFIEQLKHSAEISLIPSHEKIARLMAQRSALRYGTKLSSAEIQTLLAQLFASSNPNYSPNGEPTMILIDMVKIGEWFASGLH